MKFTAFQDLRTRVGRCKATWKVHVRLPGKGISNSHSARPVHQIIILAGIDLAREEGGGRFQQLPAPLGVLNNSPT